MGWNPNDYTPENAQGAKREDKPVPAGVYLVGVTWMERKSEKLTKLGCKLIDGPLKGRMFFPAFFTDMGKTFNADQAYYFSKATGLDEIEWHFTEDWFREHVVGSALKVRMSVEKDGKYTNRNIRQAFDRDLLSKDERQILLTWEDDFKQGRGSSGGSGDFDDSEDDWTDQESGEPDGVDERPKDDFGDDDIPF